MNGDCLEDLGLVRRIILKLAFRVDGEAWIGGLWLRMGTGDGLL